MHGLSNKHKAYAPRNFQLTPDLPSIMPTPMIPPTMHCELELGSPWVSLFGGGGGGSSVSVCKRSCGCRRPPPPTPTPRPHYPSPTNGRTHPLRRDEDDEGGGELGSKATGRGQAGHLRAHGLGAVC